MRLRACKSALDSLPLLAQRRLRFVGMVSVLVAIVCGWPAHAAAWQAPIPGSGLPAQAVRAPPSESKPMLGADSVTFPSDGEPAWSEQEAAPNCTPGAIARFVNPQTPVVELLPPTFTPPTGEPSDGMNDTGVDLSPDAAAGCSIPPPADSAQRSHLWRWIPRGKIPSIAPPPPNDRTSSRSGEPLLGAGWRSQPFAINTFAGVTAGGALIPGRVNQLSSFYGGLNFGWDYDPYWGIEKRLGFGALELSDGNHRPIPKTGLSVTGEYRLMYYPLGDCRWRPFFTAGLGWSDFYFNDDRGTRHLDTTGVIPFGCGLKCLYTERAALRVDLIDELNFGTGPPSTFHYAALTAGLEFRYGKRLLHMPWHRQDDP
jgi:hypothetical protein